MELFKVTLGKNFVDVETKDDEGKSHIETFVEPFALDNLTTILRRGLQADMFDKTIARSVSDNVKKWVAQHGQEVTK